LCFVETKIPKYEVSEQSAADTMFGFFCREWKLGMAFIFSSAAERRK
jgi:hypothetical protein